MKTINIFKTAWAFMIVAITLFAVGCGGGSKEASSEDAAPPKSMVEEASVEDPMANKGIGPVTSITLGEVDSELAAQGMEVYNQMCTACHKADVKYIGPAPKGIMERRSPEWIMNMILNPVEMVEKDPIAKALLIEYNGAPMANQNLTEDQARAVLEYFRTL
jgi:mono/diheme cytochrome c family protein